MSPPFSSPNVLPLRRGHNNLHSVVNLNDRVRRHKSNHPQNTSIKDAKFSSGF